MRTLAKLTLLAAIVAAPTAPASSTPGSGFTPSGIVNGHFGKLDVKTESNRTGHWGMVLKTQDDTDIGADRLTLAPSAYSGWHAHPGPVFVTVTQGSVTWYDGSDPLCPPRTYTVGESFIERPYVVHNAKNASTTAGAEYIAVTVKPEGFVGPAFRLDRPQPTNCNF